MVIGQEDFWVVARDRQEQVGRRSSGDGCVDKVFDNPFEVLPKGFILINEAAGDWSTWVGVFFHINYGEVGWQRFTQGWGWRPRAKDVAEGSCVFNCLPEPVLRARRDEVAFYVDAAVPPFVLNFEDLEVRVDG